MTVETLSETLETYLATLGSSVTPAESPMIAALRAMATQLDAQIADEGAVASLLATYTRELARFQKARANMPAVDPLAAALDALNAPAPTTNDAMNDS